jgi:hypothetical protein
MTHFPQPNPTRRALRIQLGNTVPAFVKLDDGRSAKGKLQTLSVTGGMLRLARALEEGDFVEVAFQTHIGPVQAMAEMLHPRRRASEEVLQPFRFIALEDNEYRTLQLALDGIADRDFLGMRTRH